MAKRAQTWQRAARKRKAKQASKAKERDLKQALKASRPATGTESPNNAPAEA